MKLALAALIALASGCGGGYSYCDMEKEIRDLEADGSMDCGSAAPTDDEQYEAVRACIADAIATNRSFTARLDAGTARKAFVKNGSRFFLVLLDYYPDTEGWTYVEYASCSDDAACTEKNGTFCFKCEGYVDGDQCVSGD